VDVHSHVGDAASPALDGAEDDNSLKGPTQPWLRSLDGLNTHDDSYALSVSGGVTTGKPFTAFHKHALMIQHPANVLPGSANAIGKRLPVISVIRSFSLHFIKVAKPLPSNYDPQRLARRHQCFCNAV
jgi:hypothetical protein